jgi:hypothetical protein
MVKKRDEGEAPALDDVRTKREADAAATAKAAEQERRRSAQRPEHARDKLKHGTESTDEGPATEKDEP